MVFSERMDQLRLLEAEITRMATELKTEITSAVASQPMRGRMINDGSNGGALMGVVKASELMKSGNWSAEYYFPQKQAEAVGKALDKCESTKEICSAIRKMLAEKRVMVRSKNSEAIYLNEDTLKILRESEIGKYVLREGAE